MVTVTQGGFSVDNDTIKQDASGNAYVDEAAIGAAPVGAIMPWAKTLTGTPALPANWVECNGQTISDAASVYDGVAVPSLNTTNRFLRGNSTSGGTGGAATHTHKTMTNNGNIGGDWTSDGSTVQAYGNGSTDNVAGTHRLHNAASEHYAESASSLPLYYDVVWIIRIK